MTDRWRGGLLIGSNASLHDRILNHVVHFVDKMATVQHLRRWTILRAVYKGDVGDEPNSPSLDIAVGLMERRLAVSIHDPYVKWFNWPLESHDLFVRPPRGGRRSRIVRS